MKNVRRKSKMITISHKKKSDQSTGIDLENHPVDMEKEILATVDATATFYSSV